MDRLKEILRDFQTRPAYKLVVTALKWMLGQAAFEWFDTFK